jgi:hypothetical protein
MWSTQKVRDVHGPSSQRDGTLEHVVCAVDEKGTKLFAHLTLVTQAGEWRDDRLDTFDLNAGRVTEVDQLRMLLTNLNSVLHD